MYREQRVKLKHYSTDDLTAAVWKTHKWFGYNYVLSVVTVGAHPVLSQELLDGHSKKSCRCSCWHSMSVFIVYRTTCCSCLVLFDLLYSQVLKIPLAMFVYGQWLPGNMWHHIVWHNKHGVFNCQYSSCTWKTCPLRFISKNMHITKQWRTMFTEALWIGLRKFQSRFACELLIVVTETGLIPPPNMECGALKDQIRFPSKLRFQSLLYSIAANQIWGAKDIAAGLM